MYDIFNIFLSFAMCFTLRKKKKLLPLISFPVHFPQTAKIFIQPKIQRLTGYDKPKIASHTDSWTEQCRDTSSYFSLVFLSELNRHHLYSTKFEKKKSRQQEAY